MLSQNKYEHTSDQYWLCIQQNAQGLFLTILYFETQQSSKYVGLLSWTRETCPTLMVFETPQQVLNLIQTGQTYDFDVKTKTFSINWQVCANKYIKDFSFKIRTTQEPLSTMDQLRIENILLKKKLSKYEPQKSNMVQAQNVATPRKNGQNTEKFASNLFYQHKTQPEQSSQQKVKRVSLIQCTSSVESDEQACKEPLKRKNEIVQKCYKQKTKLIKKDKVKLQEPIEAPKKKPGRKKKSSVQTSTEEKSGTTASQPNAVKIDFENGDYYFGQIKNNLYHGHGLYFSLTNGTFEGKWQYGKANGEGISKDPIGNQHSGFYINDKRNGKGLDVYINGERYQGNFENDAKSGQGKYIYENGDCYEGQWKNDMYHGYGIEKYCDGTVYEGNWLDDEKHGDSVFTDKEGHKWKQKWQKGTKISEELM